jgi:hypothetical protein
MVLFNNHAITLNLSPDNQSPADVDEASVVDEASLVGELEGTLALPSEHGDSVRCDDDLEPPATEPLDQADSPVVVAPEDECRASKSVHAENPAPVSEGNESAFTAEEASLVDRSVFRTKSPNAQPVNPVIAVEERIVSLDELSSERRGDVAIDTTTDGGAAVKAIGEFVGQMDQNPLPAIGSYTPELDSEQSIKSSTPVSGLVLEDSFVELPDSNAVDETVASVVQPNGNLIRHRLPRRRLKNEASSTVTLVDSNGASNFEWNSAALSATVPTDEDNADTSNHEAANDQLSSSVAAEPSETFRRLRSLAKSIPPAWIQSR